MTKDGMSGVLSMSSLGITRSARSLHRRLKGLPLATVGITTCTHKGGSSRSRPNLLFTGIDLDGDGIPDVLCKKPHGGQPVVHVLDVDLAPGRVRNSMALPPLAQQPHPVAEATRSVARRRIVVGAQATGVDASEAAASKAQHLVTIGIDTMDQGRANLLFTGVDLDGDGIPDALRRPKGGQLVVQNVCLEPSMELAALQGSKTKRKNLAQKPAVRMAKPKKAASPRGQGDMEARRKAIVREVVDETGRLQECNADFFERSMQLEAIIRRTHAGMMIYADPDVDINITVSRGGIGRLTKPGSAETQEEGQLDGEEPQVEDPAASRLRARSAGARRPPTAEPLRDSRPPNAQLQKSPRLRIRST